MLGILVPNAIFSDLVRPEGSIATLERPEVGDDERGGEAAGLEVFDSGDIDFVIEDGGAGVDVEPGAPSEQILSSKKGVKAYQLWQWVIASKMSLSAIVHHWDLSEHSRNTSAQPWLRACPEQIQRPSVLFD